MRTITRHVWQSRFFRLVLVSGVAVFWLLMPMGRQGPVIMTYPATPLVALAAAPAGDMCAWLDDTQPEPLDADQTGATETTRGDLPQFDMSSIPTRPSTESRWTPNTTAP